MRSSLIAFLSLFLSVAAFAADLKVKVLDPQSAVVGGAQLALLRPGESTILATGITSVEGTFTFQTDSALSYRLQVLAAGFARETIDISSSFQSRNELTVNLHLATNSETIVVTATRTPVSAGESGADVNSLSGVDLATMQPVAANDSLRFLPGAILETAGQRGGISSLFVRGGESTYNKVIVDGVVADNPGLTFDFGTLPLTEADRLEFVRGAQSTLFGSDAMTGVIQVWSRNGSTSVPELRFSADGGTFGTAHGFASLSGVFRRFDYNFFGDQFNTNGQGVNNAYSNSLDGANLGVSFTNRIVLRARVRHSNSYSGVPGEWNFNGYDPPVTASGGTEPLQPGPDEHSHLNNFLGSVELAVSSPSGWQHRLTGFDSLYRYTDTNLNTGPYVYDSFADIYSTHDNRAGFEYQGDCSERTWARTTFGYRLENETGLVNDQDFPPEASGQRLQQDLYVQQQATLGRLSVIGGGRFVHNSAYGNTGVPRVALTLLALRGGEVLSGTRLRFSYSTGFMAPALYEVFGESGYGYAANPNLLPERTRAFEAGIEQRLFAGRWTAKATYFNNLFHSQIEASPLPTGEYEFFNLGRSFAHGAEGEFQGNFSRQLSLLASYTYLSTQILSDPACVASGFCSFPNLPGDPLLRRPKHSGTILLVHLGTRWGANLGGSFVGSRSDYDFPDFSPPYQVYHAAGYARVDLGGWYAITPHVAAYASIQNALNNHYNEVVGFPAQTANFRAGFRFRIGGEQ